MKHIQSRRQHHLAIVQVGGRVAALLLTSVTFLASGVFHELFWYSYVCMTGLNMNSCIRAWLVFVLNMQGELQQMEEVRSGMRRERGQSSSALATSTSSTAS